MAKAKYIGDPNDNGSGPDTLDVRGFTYTKDKAVTVDAEEAALLAKNSHFEVTGQKKASDAPLAETGIEVIMGSTTGDPETTSRESMVSQDSDDAADPMQEPT